MKRKFIVGALALLMTAGYVNAQTSQFGIKGGYNAGKMTTDQSGTTTKGVSTFNAGLVADLGITEMLSVRTGLDLQGKGGKWTNSLGTATLNPMYLELPVTLTLNFPLGETTKLYAGAGPYVAVGVGGNIKTTGTFLGVANGSEKIKFGNANTDHLKRVDAGLNVAGGLKFNDRFGIHTQYGIGLVNVAPTAASNSKKNNTRTFGVSGILYF